MIIPTLDVVDQAVNQVNDKMQYFESRSNQLLTDLSQTLSSIGDIKIEEIRAPIDLPKPDVSGYSPLPGITTPELNATLPSPPVLNIDIQKPNEMVAPNFSGLNIDIPDAPI